MALYTETGCDGCDLVRECHDYIGSEEREIMSGIAKETFIDMSVDSKLCVLFDYIMDIQESAPKRVRDRDLKCDNQTKKCNTQFKNIDRRLDKLRLMNTVAAFIGGFIGGWSAVWASFKFSIFGL